MFAANWSNWTAFQTSNAFEALLWWSMGLGVIVVSLVKGPWRAGLLPGLALIAFGFSDVVEMQTGAWWRPWWLLAWKIACVFFLAWILAGHYMKRWKVG